MQRSEGGGSFEAVDMLNGRLLCGCDDVHACLVTLLQFLIPLLTIKTEPTFVYYMYIYLIPEILNHY